MIPSQPPPAAAAGPAPLTTIAALAEQLRDGPLQCLAALQVSTAALAQSSAGSEQQRLEEFEDLVRLAQCAMNRFHQFTNDLRTFVEQVAGQSADAH
jgi:signal transduction histidine kinase